MAQPSSFYGGQPPQISKLPMPGNAAAALQPGLDAVTRAVGNAAEQTQATDLRVDQIERQRQLQVQTGDIAASLATEQGKLTEDLLALRNKPDYSEAAVDQRIETFRQRASELVGNDPDLHSRFVDNIAGIAATARTGEVKWGMEQRAKKSAADGDTLQNAVQSNIRTAVANGTFSETMLADADKLDATYVSAQPIPQSVKDEWLKDRHRARLVTVIDARTDVDPHGVIADIDAGKYGEVDDKVLGTLRSAADVAARRIDNEARQAANEAAGAHRAQAQNGIEDVNAGVLVDSKTLETWRAEFAGSDKPEDIKLVHDLETAIAKNKTTATYDASTQEQRRAALAEIETHKGWQQDKELVAAHTQLISLINRDDAAADKDPISLYQRQTGQKVGQLALGDPAAMQGRFIAADRAAQRFGKPLPMIFTAPEADQLKNDWNHADVNGKADFIQTLGAYGSQRARQMMAQISPRPELWRLAELASSHDPAVQGVVREASDGSAVPMKEGVSGAVRALAQREMGSALARMPGDRQAAIVQVATWVYAHRAAAAGKANVFDPNLARAAIGAALGGGGSKGGLGRRNGSDVVLPMGATQDDFDRVLAMGAAHGFRQAANGHPTWSTGKPMKGTDLLDLVPVQINDTGSQTLYAFRSPGGSGFVKTEKGDDYVLDIRALSAHLRQTVSFNQQLADHGYVRR